MTDDKIRKLERKIEAIKQKEAERAEKKRLEENYKRFLNRPSDWIIGKAHAEVTFKDNGWHHSKGHQMPQAVNIHGNSGKTYYPTAWLTNASNNYFHNVWDTNQEREFEKELNSLVQKYVEKMLNNPRNVLELMGLQSTHYWVNEYPDNKKEKVKAEIQKEQDKILDKFSDKQLQEVGHLLHSNSILKSYLKRKRPHLVKDEDTPNMSVCAT